MDMKNSRFRKRIMTLLTVFAVAAVSLGPVTPLKAADKEYKVSFKAGSKGTIDGASSYDITAGYKATVNLDTYEPLVQPKEGYYFTGWSPDASGNVEITKKTTFVAQYARIIDKAVYRVNYVDTYGNAVATQKVVTTNDGARISETALEITDYAVDAAVKTATANKDGSTEITFIYTSTVEPNVVVETETVVLPGGTTITVVGGGQTVAPAGTTGGGAAGTTTPAAGQTTPPAGQEGQTTVQNPDQEVPLANQNAADSNNTKKSEDEEVPLANEEVSSNTWVYGVAGAVLLIAIAAVIYAYTKRKKD